MSAIILTEGLRTAVDVCVFSSSLLIAVGIRIYRFATAADQ